jgi:enoyl-CoA hydratase
MHMIDYCIRMAGPPLNERTTESGPYLSAPSKRRDLWLNRSRLANRLDDGDIHVLHRLLDEVNADLDVRLLVLRASGPTFCAGYDLKALGAQDRDQSPGFDALVDVLEGLRVPTIAALTGSVYGGGTDLALACDFRIGVRGIEFSMPAARLGIQYYYRGMQRYVSRLGLGAAKRLFLRSEKLGADEMARIGILDELVEQDQFEQRIDAYAADLVSNSPAAVQGMKKSLNRIAAGTADQKQVDSAWRESLGSPDLREALAALAASRVAKFSSPN